MQLADCAQIISHISYQSANSINGEEKQSMVNSKLSNIPPLMTCKYCILNELGHCRKINPMANEPRYLRLQNGTILSLEFDCKNCEMLIRK